MAVIMRKIEQVNPVTVRVELFADSVSELSTADIPVPTGMNIQAGSYCYDADGKLAIYNSSEEWNIVS